jgi:hypothetical protein
MLTSTSRRYFKASRTLFTVEGKTGAAGGTLGSLGGAGSATGGGLGGGSSGGGDASISSWNYRMDEVKVKSQPMCCGLK